MANKLSRRSLLRALATTIGAAGGSAATACQIDQTHQLRGKVLWCNRARALLRWEREESPGQQVLMRVPGLPAPRKGVQDVFRPGRKLALIVRPPSDAAALAPVEVQALVSDEGEQLLFKARVVSMTWGEDRMNVVLRIVAAHFGTSVAEIVSERRDRSVLRARQTAIYLAHRHTTHSLMEIGRRVGNRDHTVVLHAIRKIETEAAHSARRRRELDGLGQVIARSEEDHVRAA